MSRIAYHLESPDSGWPGWVYWMLLLLSLSFDSYELWRDRVVRVTGNECHEFCGSQGLDATGWSGDGCTCSGPVEE